MAGAALQPRERRERPVVPGDCRAEGGSRWSRARGARRRGSASLAASRWSAAVRSGGRPAPASSAASAVRERPHRIALGAERRPLGARGARAKDRSRARRRARPDRRRARRRGAPRGAPSRPPRSGASCWSASAAPRSVAGREPGLGEPREGVGRARRGRARRAPGRGARAPVAADRCQRLAASRKRPSRSSSAARPGSSPVRSRTAESRSGRPGASAAIARSACSRAVEGSKAARAARPARSSRSGASAGPVARSARRLPSAARTSPEPLGEVGLRPQHGGVAGGEGARLGSGRHGEGRLGRR